MKASEARKISEGIPSKNMLPIYIAIKEHAALGQFELFWYKGLSKSEVDELESKGYKVKFDSGARNDSWHSISW